MSYRSIRSSSSPWYFWETGVRAATKYILGIGRRGWIKETLGLRMYFTDKRIRHGKRLLWLLLWLWLWYSGLLCLISER